MVEPGNEARRQPFGEWRRFHPVPKPRLAGKHQEQAAEHSSTRILGSVELLTLHETISTLGR